MSPAVVYDKSPSTRSTEALDANAKNAGGLKMAHACLVMQGLRLRWARLAPYSDRISWGYEMLIRDYVDANVDGYSSFLDAIS